MQEYENNPQPGYYGLCHGDFHTRNMMFKHNKETGCFGDYMLVDFQGCYVAPLALDLIYSYMMMGQKQRTDNFEISLNCYFSVLLEPLRKIDYLGKLPTPLALWSEMKRLREIPILEHALTCVDGS
ncbi:uncharacterized protein LOC108143890 [Drosophila elegans]|uniref:uncharacterized protein LOC108143890 n=1 Tax=Drosophila elegans TaxID=30023 RepID=UPI0007E5E877|nr:uncharacterized protein LOC108143890 [Drosophila elegans]